MSDAATVTEKRCPRCDTVKPASAFSRSSSSVDGLQGHCRTCQSTNGREYRQRKKQGGPVRTYRRRGIDPATARDLVAAADAGRRLLELYRIGHTPNAINLLAVLRDLPAAIDRVRAQLEVSP